MNGVSIVICCHNSSQRLSETLRHIIEQKVESGIPWEVIVVDNASTDDTAELAKAILVKNQNIPFQVVHEPQLGLSHARDRGLGCAKYDLVSFVDDDNWVAPDWVQTVFTIMTEHPEVGACGGRSEAVFETEPPVWFNNFQGSYAVGQQADASGDVTLTRGYLWGAGLTIRKSIWEQLRFNGFRSLLADRQGMVLSSGGDTELCLAFILAGWKLRYDERLKFQHFMPPSRLQWSYLRRLHRGFGVATVGVDPYLFALEGNPARCRDRLRPIWASQAYVTFRKLLKYRWRFIKDVLGPAQEDVKASLRVESLLGRLTELLQRRDAYDKSIMEICKTPWGRLPTLKMLRACGKE